MKSLLEKEITWADIKTALIDVGPLGVFMSLFKKKEKEIIAFNAQEHLIQHRFRQAPPPPAGTSGSAGTFSTSGSAGFNIIKSERNISSFNRIYGDSAHIGMATSMIKEALINDLIKEATNQNAVTFKTYKKLNSFNEEEEFISAEIKIF